MRMDTLASQMGSIIKEATLRLLAMGLLPRLLLLRQVQHRVLAGSYQPCSKSFREQASSYFSRLNGIVFKKHRRNRES